MQLKIIPILDTVLLFPFLIAIKKSMIQYFFIIIFLLIASAKALAANSALIWDKTAETICTTLNQASLLYEQKHTQEAYRVATQAYFSHYDAIMEPAVRTTIGNRHVFEIEQQFRALSDSIHPDPSAADIADIKAKAAELCQAVKADALILNQTHAGFWTTLFSAFLILLREGFEALLVVTALLAYVRRAQPESAKGIYWGTGFALIASGITAYLLSTVFQAFAAHKEALEGITMLIAALVLMYVSYWIFSKRETAHWKQYIQNQIRKGLATGSMLTLSTAAFLAVYREGAETILFYQALAISSAHQMVALMLGTLIATISLIIFYQVLKRASIKIPFRLFFSITALFLYYMAFRFIGGGISELQESGWISITPVAHMLTMTWLGVYPTIQSLLAQLACLILTLVAYLIWKWRMLKTSSAQASS